MRFGGKSRVARRQSQISQFIDRSRGAFRFGFLFGGLLLRREIVVLRGFADLVNERREARIGAGLEAA